MLNVIIIISYFVNCSCACFWVLMPAHLPAFLSINIVFIKYFALLLKFWFRYNQWRRSLYFLYIPILRYPSYFLVSIKLHTELLYNTHIAHGSNHFNGSWFNFKINCSQRIFDIRMFDFPIQLKSIHSKFPNSDSHECSLWFRYYSFEALKHWSHPKVSSTGIESKNLPHAICLILFFCLHFFPFICYWTFELVEESFLLNNLVMVKAFELNKKKAKPTFLGKRLHFHLYAVHLHTKP